MSQEQEVRLQFLDEAQDYIDSIETPLLGLSESHSLREPHQTCPQKLDGILRAAHSLKGGAAMMGYPTLSHLAHRLEDFFKVIRVTKASSVDRTVESLLLDSLDCLRQCLTFYRQNIVEIDENWLYETVNPIFEQLRQQIGEPQPQDDLFLLSEETGEDMSVFLFQTEVEGCLQRLEQILVDPKSPCLREECQLTAQELGGLGEMLELTNFSQLCESINQVLQTAADEEVQQLVDISLQTWRRSQALVIIGQSDMIPSQLELLQSELIVPPTQWLQEIDDFANEDFSFLESLTETTERTNQPVLSSASITSPNESLPTDTNQKVVSVAVETLTETSSPNPSENTIRVPVRQLEQLGDLMAELMIERNGLNLQLSSLRHLMGLLSQRVKTLQKSNHDFRTVYDEGTLLSQNELAVRSRGKARSVGTEIKNLPDNDSFMSLNRYFDHLEMDRYSDFHILFQELIETIVQIQEVTDDLDTNLDTTQRTARQLTSTSQQLQRQLTGVRMRPFSDLVGRFPRAIRDMSLKYNKPINLKISGNDILIDRSVLEALSDPLLHLLRNAFDHGIEDSATRIALGKPSQGTIEVSATYRGNQTVIILRDDGSGIDLDKISTKALQMGLTPTDLEQVNQQDLLNLIFEPGFSTAETVTDLSGRGIGMDIVRTKIQEVRGQIQVETQPGQGTTFTITMPFTLTVVKALLVESGGMLLAFPNYGIEEMLIPTPEMRLISAGQSYLNWDEQLVPLIELKQWLRFSRPLCKPQINTIPVIAQTAVLMIDRGNQVVGLEIDSYWGEQEVTIRTIEGNFPLPSGFTGCTILGDGRVVPLVDVHTLLNWIEKPQTHSQSDNLTQVSFNSALSGEITGQKALIMVIDDSINVRRFLALTLEKAGYQVQQAKDGQEALEQLQDGLPVAAVICDIEMPRLDGYGFLTYVRSQPQFCSLPVLMLTSRSGEKHRKIALNLGATAYFCKPFHESELLDTLKAVVQ